MSIKRETIDQILRDVETAPTKDLRYALTEWATHLVVGWAEQCEKAANAADVAREEVSA